MEQWNSTVERTARYKMLLCLTLTLICSSRALGSPGAAWTDQETLTVKAKLYAILGEYGHGSQVSSSVILFPLQPFTN